MSQPDSLPRVALFVADLDNTLYDWFAMWYPAFNAMLEAVCSKSGVPRDVLLPEIRAIHQQRGTSEYSYLLNELPSLKKLNPPEEITKVYGEAIHRYRLMRQQNLHLYPGVGSALAQIKESGVPIVVYTESLGFYSAWRLRELHLDGVVDYLYSPPDHDFPEGVTPEMLRSRPPEAYELEKTEYRETPRGVLKPDPQILKRILRELGISASETAYVGDSLMKDVAMAQDADVVDVLAQYGAVKDRNAYRLLQQVSHWTEDDVRRESQINDRPDIAPSYTLHDRFDEIFNFFRFGDQRDRR